MPTTFSTERDVADRLREAKRLKSKVTRDLGKVERVGRTRIEIFKSAVAKLQVLVGELNIVTYGDMLDSVLH